MALPHLKFSTLVNTGSRQRLWLLYLGLAALGAGLCWQQQWGWPAPLILLAAWLLLVLALHWALRPLWLEIAALNLQAQNLQEGSFNVDANQQRLCELTPLAGALAAMSSQLRQERATLYQRELLLDTVLQSSPVAILLTAADGRLLMSNPAARNLLWHGRRCEGLLLNTLLDAYPALFAAIGSQQSGLLQLEQPAGVWHLSVGKFLLNQQQHQLYLIKPLTQELQREEVKAWKKLLRVIGHELNNTLAPLSSLAFSGATLAERQQDAVLSGIFQTIADRTAHLNQFLQAYLQFAKLPPPSRSLVNWPRLINQLQDQYDFELLGDLPGQAWQLDTQQLSQLLLNLLKNAHESGSPPDAIVLQLLESPTELRICLQDGGGGLPDEVLTHAMVPFYTTKTTGSGIGLTLCSDIAQAHGGSLTLQNQPPGLLVTVSLPARLNTAL
jgi:nitrogen fixation/metabolism regulation signal transduction histidine kinase